MNDSAYVNAVRNSDRQNARDEGFAAIRRIAAASTDMRFLKLYNDNAEFRNGLRNDVLAAAYKEVSERPAVLQPQEPTASAYGVGDFVWLDGQEFKITDLQRGYVELLPPEMTYPIYRTERRADFERLLRRDERNRHITDYLEQNAAEHSAVATVPSEEPALSDEPVRSDEPVQPEEPVPSDEAKPKYRESKRLNVLCKEAIEQTVRDNYRDNRLDADAVWRDVTAQFGAERTAFVLAMTVREKDFDGRFSRENKAWAKTQPLPPDPEHQGLYCSYVVDKAHPVLTDALVTHVRRELERKPSVMEKLQSAETPPKSAMKVSVPEL